MVHKMILPNAWVHLFQYLSLIFNIYKLKITILDFTGYNCHQEKLKEQQLHSNSPQTKSSDRYDDQGCLQVTGASAPGVLPQ